MASTTPARAGGAGAGAHPPRRSPRLGRQLTFRPASRLRPSSQPARRLRRRHVGQLGPPVQGGGTRGARDRPGPGWGSPPTNLLLVPVHRHPCCGDPHTLPSAVLPTGKSTLGHCWPLQPLYRHTLTHTHNHTFADQPGHSYTRFSRPDPLPWTTAHSLDNWVGTPPEDPQALC